MFWLLLLVITWLLVGLRIRLAVLIGGTLFRITDAFATKEWSNFGTCVESEHIWLDWNNRVNNWIWVNFEYFPINESKVGVVGIVSWLISVSWPVLVINLHQSNWRPSCVGNEADCTIAIRRPKQHRKVTKKSERIEINIRVI